MMRAPIAKVVSPAPRDIWENLIEQDSSVLVSQTPGWIDAMRAMGYRDASRLYEMANGRQMVLPLVRRAGLPAGLARYMSFPNGWGIGGLVTSDGEQRCEDMAAVLDDLAEHTGVGVSIRPNPLHCREWAASDRPGIVTVPRYAHVLDLEGGFAKVWMQRFKSSKRTAVRKAKQSGIQVECDSSGSLVTVFYELWERSLTRWASQQHEPVWLTRLRGLQRDPILKFDLMAKHLKGACHIWVARRKGEPIAAIVVLQGANAHATRAVMNEELAGPVRASDLLHCCAIEAACKAGCRHYHFGESGQSKALAQFKGSFGAEGYAYAEYRLERLPITPVDQWARCLVKRAIGFKDVPET